MKHNNYQIAETLKKNRNLFIAAGLFLLAATISIFTSSNLRAALGEWKAFYIEPFLLFIILITSIKERKQLHTILFALILSGFVTSLLAIYQHFTGWMVPWFFWENGNSFRVTGWYGFPNAVGLFLAPLFPLALYMLKQNYLSLRKKFRVQSSEFIMFLCSLLFVPCSLLAIVYAKSTGALIGIAASIGILLLLWKKTRWPALVLGLVCIAGLFSLPSDNPIKHELTFQDRSGQIRIHMWAEAVELLKANPIFGAGLASYQDKVTPYHTTVAGEGIEIFHHPHNIFLTMYVNLGLLGLFAFIWMVVWFYRVGLQHVRHPLTPYLLATMAVVVTHGLVDSPYIKNDLALLFWTLPALLIVNKMELNNYEK